METDIVKALQEHFGFDQFQPGQREVIDHLLAGRSAAAVFPTGGGKSLCYQLPALLLPGITLVVSPLIALMKDQIDALARRGIAARRLDSSLSLEEYREVMQQLRDGTLRLLYVAPERFNNERFRAAISELQISLFAVDEAHCISEWGHNFRPDYLKLANIAETLGAERILALTATATPAVQADIQRLFQIDDDCTVCIPFYRANLQLLSRVVNPSNRDASLLDVLSTRDAGPGIIYVTRQNAADSLATMLAQRGWPARAYHAGMSPEARAEVQEWFLADDYALVVATIAFGMGIDKPNIRYVYHYNPPKSLENYAQEIGRAGRDGGASVCEIFYCPDDLCALENFIYGDTPDLAAVTQLVERVFDLGEQFDLALQALANRCDLRILVLRTLLTYMELEGLLKEGTPFYADYRFQPLQSSAEILAQFDGERREFLRGLLVCAKKARTWFSIDLDACARKLRCNRDRVVKAMDWLGEQQMLRVEAAGVRHSYRRLRMPDDLDALADGLYQRMLKRETAEVGRLTQVVELINLPSCRSVALAAHFDGSLSEDCGQCTACLGQIESAAESTGNRSAETIDPGLRSRIRELLDDHPMSSERVLARFVCGITSPSLNRAKLTKHALFGVLSETPFASVLAWCGALLSEQQQPDSATD